MHHAPHPPSKHIHPPPQSHFSMKKQLTLNRYNQQQLVIVECSHEIEVIVAKRLGDGGRRNALTVNYMPDSHIPWKTSAWYGLYISPIWLINLLTHIKVMHYSAPFRKLKSHTMCIMFYLCCLIWCSVFTHSIPMLHNACNFRSPYLTLIPHNMHQQKSHTVNSILTSQYLNLSYLFWAFCKKSHKLHYLHDQIPFSCKS